MFEFLTRLFRRSTSSATARERLKLVLLSDHLALAPDVVDAMRNDLLQVIARYCDIDPASAEVGFERREHGIEMYATVAIRALNGRGMTESTRTRASSPSAPAAPAAPALSVERGTDTAFASDGQAGQTAHTPVPAFYDENAAPTHAVATETRADAHASDEDEEFEDVDDDELHAGGEASAQDEVVAGTVPGKKRRRRRRKPAGAYPATTGTT